jgi:hypothetical protein
MVTAEEATAAIRKHFAEITPDQFAENLRRFCPELFEDGGEEGVETHTPKDEVKSSAA